MELASHPIPCNKVTVQCMVGCVRRIVVGWRLSDGSCPWWLWVSVAQFNDILLLCLLKKCYHLRTPVTLVIPCHWESSLCRVCLKPQYWGCAGEVTEMSLFPEHTALCKEHAVMLLEGHGFQKAALTWAVQKHTTHYVYTLWELVKTFLSKCCTGWRHPFPQKITTRKDFGNGSVGCRNNWPTNVNLQHFNKN